MKIPFPVKVCVSAVLITVLVISIDLPSILNILSHSEPSLVLCAIGASLLFFVVNTRKWQVLLDRTDNTATYGQLLRLNLLGQFYNMVLPGQIGGEVVKSMRLARFNVKAERCAVSVLADRVTGLLALMLLGLLGLALSPSAGEASRIFLPWIILLTTLLACLVVLLVAGRGFGIVAAVGDATPWRNTRIAKSVSQRIHAIQADTPESGGWRFILAPMALSFAGQVVVGLMNLLICLSLGIHLALPTIMWITAIVLVAQALPISVAGLGVREGMYVYLLVQQGISAHTALAVSLLVFVTQIIPALLGGIYELRDLLSERQAGNQIEG